MYRITQTTEYSYSRSANHSINQLRLTPLSDATQTCLNFDIEVNVPVQRYDYGDYWGNRVTTLYIRDPHMQLTIRTIADVNVTIPVDAPVTVLDTALSASKNTKQHHETGYRQLYAEYLAATPYTTLGHSESWHEESLLWQRQPDIATYAEELNHLLYENFQYSQGATTVTTTAAEFLRHRQGVCQDFAHLMLSLCRNRGIAARYVSGYLYCGEDSALHGDAAMHAWVEVHVPDTGWVGFDPTNNVRTSQQHIRVATGRDYSDITPVKGVVNGGGEQQSGGSVRVQCVMEHCAPSCS